MSAAQSDKALYERWREKRDADAFAELVSRHADMVFAACKRVLGNATDAEDAAQESFLQLMDTRVRVRTSVAPWLYTVAVRRAVDMARRRATMQRYERMRDDKTEPHARVENDDLRNAIDEAIAQLPPRYRDVVIERFLNGRTHADLAQSLGVSESTIRYRLTRGVEGIRRTLKRKGIHTSAGTVLAVFGAGLAESAPASLIANLGRHAISGSNAGHAAATAAIGEALIMKKAMIGTATVLAALLVGFGTLRFVHDEPALTEVTNTIPSAIDARSDKKDTPAGASPTVTNPIIPTVDSVAIAPPATPQLEHCEIADPALYCSVSGRVVDEDGEPVPDAEVMLVCQGYEEHETIDPTDEWTRRALKRNHHFRTVTNASGNYTVDGIRYRGRASVVASRDVFATNTWRFILHEGEHRGCPDLILDAAMRVTLVAQILSSDGQPVRDGVVRTEGMAGTGFAYTDEDGSVSVTAQPLTDVGYLIVCSPTLGSATFTDVPFGKGETVVLTMPRPATLRGRVDLADVPDAGELAVRLEGGIPSWSYEDDGSQSLQAVGKDMSYETTVDASGQYRIPGVDAGQYYFRVAVQAGDGTVYAEDRLGMLSPGVDTVWNAELGDTAIVTGIVRGAQTGRPLNGSSLDVWALREGNEIKRTDVGSDGRYVLELPAIPGAYQICPAYDPFHGSVYTRYGKEAFLDSGQRLSLDLTIQSVINNCA